MTTYRFMPQTNQEVFDAAITYFIGRTQPCRNADGDSCEYTNHEDDHCAIGAMISPLPPRLRSVGVNSLWLSHYGLDIFNKRHYITFSPDLNPDLLVAVQGAHDLGYHWTGCVGFNVAGWNDLLEIGEKFHLDTDAIYKQLELVNA